MSKQAERIKELRSKFDWSQDDLAEQVGVSQRQVSRYEVGVSIPSDVLMRMADVLQVNADYILGRVDDPTPYSHGDTLEPDERAVISALRRGDKLEAIRIISSREP
jgi:transcriptional regulator with XRE-family HTH domain